MIRVVTLRTADDESGATTSAWEKVNRAQAEVTPGLLEIEVNRISSTPGFGANAYGLLVKLTFIDKAAFESAQNTEQGRDLLGYTKGLVSMFVIEKTDRWTEPENVPPASYFGG